MCWPLFAQAAVDTVLGLFDLVIAAKGAGQRPGAGRIHLILALQLLPVDDGVGPVEQAVSVIGAVLVVKGQALALVVLACVVVPRVVGGALVDAAVHVLAALEQFGGHTNAVPAGELLLNLEQQAVLIGIAGVGLGALGAQYIAIALSVELVALAPAGLE